MSSKGPFQVGKNQTFKFSQLVDFLRIFEKSLFSRFVEKSTMCLLNMLIPVKFTL